MYYRVAVVAGVFILALIRPAQAVTLEWVQQLGITRHDVARSVSADGSGNVYIAGLSYDSRLGASTPLDAFVAKYDPAGSLQWLRQLGDPSGVTAAHAVSADRKGNVYISGNTHVSLGGPNAGSDDAFLAKYDAAGNLQWTRQLGSSDRDGAGGVSADGLGNVYISGNTSGELVAPNPTGQNGFLSKYDDAGQLQWTKQIGGSEATRAHTVSLDDMGNVYTTGETFGSLSGPNAGGLDIFLAKYDAAGNALWMRQRGTSEHDYANDVSADRLGNVYVAGDSKGSLGGSYVGGAYDGFLAKYDTAGELQWTRQIGTPYDDRATGVAPDGLGNLYVTGTTEGDLLGATSGLKYVYIAKFDSLGARQWITQMEVTRRSSAFGVSTDGLGTVYISGIVYSGDTDDSLGRAFVAKYRDVPSGDFNNDGTVEAADYVVWRNGLGSTYSQADYDAWRANFGRSDAGAASVATADLSSSGNSAVPEPTALLLAGLSLAPLARRVPGVNRCAAGAHRRRAITAAG
jgi:hypothetical protein